MRFLPSLFCFSLFVFTPPAASASAVRAWRSADGSKSFQAEFLASDGARVTLKRGDGRILTFDLAKLHEDDRAWVRESVDPADLAADAPPPKGAAFDQLQFGDDRNTVEAKLKNSKFVTAALDESLFGRTGLNGVFKTTQTIGGLHCFLFFDWTTGGGLREVTLQTQPVDKSKYNSLLQSNWYELIQLLGKLHGNAIQQAPYPEPGELQDGLLLGSHLWYTEDGHSVILCTGQERDKYLVAVRITSEHIVPVQAPVTGSAPPPSTNGRRVAPR
jgi:hypothetical protein